MKPGPAKELLETYRARLRPPPEIREIEIKKRLTGPALAEAEGAALLDTVPDGAHVIVLDERGRALTSMELANHIRQQKECGTAHFAFLIGGADGHNKHVRSRADLLLSFGKLTWPHMLARVMLMEQIYRIETILTGHPYHRE